MSKVRRCCVLCARDAAAERVIAMSGMKNYRELDAWQLAMTLVETTYALS